MDLKIVIDFSSLLSNLDEANKKNIFKNMVFLNNISEKIYMVLITLKIKYMPVWHLKLFF